VFHVAATSDYWRSNRTRLYLINVNGTTNVLDAARCNGVRRVIFTSSGAAVGVLDDRPSDERVPFNLPSHEFAYGHSKWLAEQEAWKAVERGLDVVALNPAIVFGPGDINQISGSAVVEMARGLVPVYPMGGATVIDVRDVAAMHLAAAEHGLSRERYILGNESLSHKAMLDMTADIVGVAAPRIPVPRSVTPLLAAAVGVLQNVGVTLPMNADQIRLSARKVVFDCQKAWQVFGPPTIPVRQSLQDTYDWYVDRGMIQRRRRS
jgi:dihydroflavonol-4-reductase